MRRQNEAGARAAQHPENLLCGEREINHQFIRQLDTAFNNKLWYDNIHQDLIRSKPHKDNTRKLTEIARNIIHLRAVEMRRYVFNYEENNQELRIQYMLNRIHETEFKNKLQIQNKKHYKHLEIHNVLTLVVDSTTDIFYRFYEVANKSREWNLEFPIFGELEVLREYVNECLADISRTYCSIKLNLTPSFELKSVATTSTKNETA